jgi:hypothetical protein
MFGIPRLYPGPHAFFQVADDLVGDPGVTVLLFASLHCFSPLRAFKKLHSLVVESGVQSGPSSHRAAGLWLATALPLTAERAVSAMGFERGNEGLKRGENEEPNK